jgi:hypothetical protein
VVEANNGLTVRVRVWVSVSVWGSVWAWVRVRVWVRCCTELKINDVVKE